MFGVGDEVICINDNDPPQSGESLHHVIKGNHYTVTRMEQRFRVVGRAGPLTIAQAEWYVFLAEVPSPKGIGFYAFRFRKVEKKKEGKSTDEGFKILDDIRKEVTNNPVKVPEKVK